MLVEMGKLQCLRWGCFYGFADSMRSKKTIVLKWQVVTNSLKKTPGMKWKGTKVGRLKVEHLWDIWEFAGYWEGAFLPEQ